jgi:hypothetical protein
VGDRFQASLEEPLTSEGNVVVAKDALVFGRLTQAKQSGTFTGRSQLRLELTGIVADGGEGAAIGAGAGAGVGATSEIITGGDQVKVPSETFLDFTLQQDVSIPTPPS